VGGDQAARPVAPGGLGGMAVSKRRLDFGRQAPVRFEQSSIWNGPRLLHQNSRTSELEAVRSSIVLYGTMIRISLSYLKYFAAPYELS
jgi:hypothetical protein